MKNELSAIEIPTPDALVACEILQAVVEGRNTESYGDEARIILDGLRTQLERVVDQD
ncbi:MAG TPA: hypothetical protein VJ836_00635 [Candidatus Saccharimonadales bacterium]|nr:hypothetical protein [Candidatus Saccharimonadales bacterium]